MILARPGDVPSEAGSRARLAGMAMVNDTARLGLRADPSRFGAKAVAAGRALAAAGISAADIGIAEVYDSYSGAQLQALEGLGLSADVVADERAGYFAADGRLPVNLSGGLLGQGARWGRWAWPRCSASPASLKAGTGAWSLQGRPVTAWWIRMAASPPIARFRSWRRRDDGYQTDL